MTHPGNQDDGNNGNAGTSTAGEPNNGNSDEGNPPGYESLGDAGKRALDAMKAERNQHKSRAAQLESELKALRDAQQTQNDSSRNGSQDGNVNQQNQQNATEAGFSREDIENSVLSVMDKRVLRSDVKAVAGSMLSDPADALALIDFSDMKPDSNGEFDASVIRERINTLVESKPYLKANGSTQSQPGTQFGGSADGGARNDAPNQQQNRDSLRGKTPEQILAEFNEGRYDDLLSGKNR